MTPERLAEIKHNLEHAGRTHYRDVSDLLTDNAALREAVRLGVQRLGDIVELAANGKQRGRYCSAECLGSCDECKAVQAARDYIAAAAVRAAKEQA